MTLPSHETLLESEDESYREVEPAEVPEMSAKRWITNRRWPLAMSGAMVVVGIVFMFAWNPVVHHNGYWDTGNDLWGIFRAAHYVGWGFLGGVYTPSNGVISFPGMPIILAPLAMLSSGLHLTESDASIVLAHPTAALVLQPVELLLTSTIVFATDALAERLSVGRKRRIAVCAVVAAIAWPIAAVWGHAEDVLAMTFAIYALRALLDCKWKKCGWLFGVGVLIQPLVLLMLPLLIGASPTGKRLLLAVRSLVLSVALAAVAFAGDPSDTYEMLVKQPTPPSVNHATPWASLAPKLPLAPVETVHLAERGNGPGHFSVAQVATKLHPTLFVAGGPGRVIDIVVALLLGVYVWRRPQEPVRLVWLAAMILGSRCFFEAVMTPYYVAPVLFLAVVLAARHRRGRFWSATILALEVTVFAYHHLNPWLWWLTVVAGVVGVLGLSYPSESERAYLEPQGELESPHGVDESDTSSAPFELEPTLEPALT